MTVQIQANASTAARVAIALTAVTGLILALFVSVSPAFGTHVTPVLFQGNPTCGDLGDYDHEFKIEPVADGTYSDPNSDFEVEIDVRSTADGQVFDWDANLPVDAVFAKGGPGGNLYVYSPAETSDTGLHAPGNDQGTAVADPPWSGLSHISFCFNDVPEETPTPSVEESQEASQEASQTPEGTQFGGTGTPEPSVPDTATGLPSMTGPLATIAFGMILLASLGALAYANVQAVRRRS